MPTRYVKLFNDFPALIWCSGTDAKCDYFNRSWLAFTGRSLAQELGDGWVEGVHPDDRSRCFDTYLSAFAARRPFTMDYRLRRHDGEYRWITDVANPVYDEAGTFLGFIGSCYDITERKQAEEVLRRYELLSRAARDIILFVRQSDGRIIEANAAALAAYGYTQEELLACTIYDLRLPGTEVQVKAEMEQARDTGISFDTVHRRKDGTVFPVEVSSRGAEIGGEQLLLSVVRDITERKRAEHELREAMQAAEAANRAKSDFLAHMSHEIRTPLTALIGLAGLLAETELDAAQREYLDLLKTSADSLVALVGDILDFSKIEAGKVVLEEQAVELESLLAESVRGFAWPAREKGLELRLEWAPGTPERIFCDPTRLRQVLANLIGNAVKFTRRGSVTVGAAACDGGVRLSISDTGIGIPADKLDRLFKDFTQVDPSTTREYGGTGLGLAISKRLVELMGGSISVESVEGRGSTFAVCLPVRARGAAEPAGGLAEVAASPEERVLPPHPAGFKVLLAEDNAVSRRVMASLLEKKGWQVTTAASGTQVLAALANEPFALVLMDVQMPEMDGVTATRELRRLGYDVPVVALTAHALQSDEQRCREAGMDDYLTKPVKSDRLHATVARWAGQRHSRVGERRERASAALAAALQQLEGDRELLTELTRELQTAWPGCRADLKQAAAAGDFCRLGKEAHRLKGALSYFGQSTVVQLARRLEEAAQAGQLAVAEDVCGQLDRGVSELLDDLAEALPIGAEGKGLGTP